MDYIKKSLSKKSNSMSGDYLSVKNEIDVSKIKKAITTQLHQTFFENYFIEICKILTIPKVNKIVFHKYSQSDFMWDGRYIACDLFVDDKAVLEGDGGWGRSFNVDIHVDPSLSLKEHKKILSKAEKHLHKARALLIFKGVNKEFFQQAWKESDWFLKKKSITLNNYQEMIGDLILQPARSAHFQAQTLIFANANDKKIKHSVL